MARIFQDSAGTIPVTTFDQPVGKIVRGAGTVDLVQSDPGKRPTMKLFAPDGAEPRWYLYCPAGTDLEAVVDAGEYEIAILDPWGGVTYEAVTSDGSTPITFTRNTLIMDVLFRSPVFSAGEKEAIEQYWSKWKLVPEVDDLFMAGQRGVFLDLSDQSTLFQTDDQTTPVTDVDDPIGLALDLSGNGVNMVQPVQTARGQYKTDGDVYRVQLDKVDDNYEFDFTGSGGFEATWYQPSKEGVVKGKLLIPDGVWKLARNNPNWFPSNNIMGLIIVEGDVPDVMDKAIFDWWEAKGCGIDFSVTPTNRGLERAFRDRVDIVEQDVRHWIANANFRESWRGCYNIRNIFGLGQLNKSVLVGDVWDGYLGIVRDCYNLKITEPITWDLSRTTNATIAFSNVGRDLIDPQTIDISGITPRTTVPNLTLNGMFNGANVDNIILSPDGNPLKDSVIDGMISFLIDTKLTQESIDNILVALAASSNDNITFTQSGGSAPSATGEAAIDALRLRSWTITVTGGY